MYALYFRRCACLPPTSTSIHPLSTSLVIVPHKSYIPWPRLIYSSPGSLSSLYTAAISFSLSSPVYAGEFLTGFCDCECCGSVGSVVWGKKNNNENRKQCCSPSTTLFIFSSPIGVASQPSSTSPRPTWNRTPSPAAVANSFLLNEPAGRPYSCIPLHFIPIGHIFSPQRLLLAKSIKCTCQSAKPNKIFLK